MSEEHGLLSEEYRFENALAIWIRDMRDEQLALVKKGGRLSVAALGYEEVLKLRGILGRFMRDRRRQIQGRWNRRRERRAAARLLPADAALTLPEVLQRLGTSTSTLHRWRQRGFPQPTYVSCVPVWSAFAVEKWLAANPDAKSRSRQFPVEKRAKLRIASDG